MNPYNEFGDGITRLSESTTTSHGWRWFNAFNVTSIPNATTETIDVYPVDTLTEFFSAVRRGEICVVGAGEPAKRIGVVKSFTRDIRGEHPNLIRVSILFDSPEDEQALPEVVWIRPVVVGEYRGYNDPDTNYKLREVTEIKGLVLSEGR